MRFYTLLAFCLLNVSANAQSSFCGTGIEDQAYLLNLRAANFNIDKADQGIIYIPLQIHNVGNDNAVGFFSNLIIFESLCTLNQDFLPSGMQFYLENEINYIRNTSWNDHPEFQKGEEMMLKNNYPNVVNCYLVANPAGNCGYYTYRGDAVALSKNCVGKNSHTWAHELGHYFSLPHTFYGWEGIRYSNGKATEDYQSQVFTSIENVERKNCKFQADNFCDTEPDYISNRWTCSGDGFSGSILKDTKDSTFRVDGTLFMSYSNDECMKRFSADQMSAMLNYYNGPRANLKRVNVNPKYIASNPIALNFPIDSVVIPPAKIILSWQAIPNATYYNLQISRTENFTVVVKNLMVNTPYVELDSLISNKNYWWKVRAFSAFDFCGSSSEVGLFRTDQIVSSDDQIAANIKSIVIPNPISENQNFMLQNGKALASEDFILTSSIGKQYELFNKEVMGDHLIFTLYDTKPGVYVLSTRKASAFKPVKLVIKNK